MTDSAFGRLRLVGKISLWFSFVAVIGLIATALLSSTPQQNYIDTIQSLAATKNNLPLVMITGGLLLTAGTGVTTWLIALYSSFRVAGPLYRFQRNLEAGIETGSVPRIRIRQNDYLQEESQLLEETSAKVDDYQISVDESIHEILATIENGERSIEALSPAINRLRSKLDNASYDFPE